jgi:acetyl-CoA synthetase
MGRPRLRGRARGRTILTYAQLQHEVRRTAAALRGLGVGRGDRVGIYMPTCVEAIVLMLACARIGAVHLVVFAGFGSGALGDRLQLAGARVLFCSDLTYRKGRDILLKGIVDEALSAQAPGVERVVVHRRGAADPPMTASRDLSWSDFLALAPDDSDSVEWLEANEPANILATSGTTAKPKLTVHTVAYEGALDHPDRRPSIALLRPIASAASSPPPPRSGC